MNTTLVQNKTTQVLEARMKSLYYAFYNVSIWVVTVHRSHGLVCTSLLGSWFDMSCVKQDMHFFIYFVQTVVLHTYRMNSCF